MNPLKIETNVPMPGRGSRSHDSELDQIRDCAKKMEVGDSVFFALGTPVPQKDRARILGVFDREGSRGKNGRRKFASRAVEGGMRVWRVF